MYIFQRMKNETGFGVTGMGDEKPKSSSEVGTSSPHQYRYASISPLHIHRHITVPEGWHDKH